MTAKGLLREEKATIRWLPVRSPITVLTSPTAAYLTSSAWDRGSSSRCFPWIYKPIALFSIYAIGNTMMFVQDYVTVSQIGTLSDTYTLTIESDMPAQDIRQSQVTKKNHARRHFKGSESTVRHEEVSKKKDRCGICLEIPQKRGCMDKCPHVFCASCILKWSETANVCPFCNKEFHSISCHENNQRKTIEVKKLDRRYLICSDDFYLNPADLIFDSDLESDDEHSDSDSDEDSFTRRGGMRDIQLATLQSLSLGVRFGPSVHEHYPISSDEEEPAVPFTTNEEIDNPPESVPNRRAVRMRVLERRNISRSRLGVRQLSNANLLRRTHPSRRVRIF
ncbi:hypothetical protein PROFUN_01927 [Planoprotostelium fungivorum]|uniref:RING-type domain-containing protein n=1 Tax=Planoprotostelium fungivorum TaxID=1890364 RepID=A0A2P6NZ20_9EUKA|nr:hypothetical protein PROFUN_01927 [Planoprotostelium fungivorum]